MGNTTSKQRRLGKTVSENATKSVNRTTNISQLPPKEMRERFEQAQQQFTDNSGSSNIEKEALQDGIHRKSDISSFDPSLLNKKIRKSAPEGKDGFDPHESGTSTYNDQFVKSISHLGKQIHSQTAGSIKMADSLAIRQLKLRKELFSKGEKEEGSDATRTMVPPKILASILNDLHDSRVSNEVIAKDHNVSADFLQGLGSRFKVANNIVIMEEKVKEGEIGHKIHSPTSLSARAEAEEGEGGDSIPSDQLERYKKLKSRISLDD